MCGVFVKIIAKYFKFCALLEGYFEIHQYYAPKFTPLPFCYIISHKCEIPALTLALKRK